MEVVYKHKAALLEQREQLFEQKRDLQKEVEGLKAQLEGFKSSKRNVMDEANESLREIERLRKDLATILPLAQAIVTLSQ